MPRVSAFYGIVIWMYHDDHNPPHFHASYGEHWAVYGIDGPALLAGSFPARARACLRASRGTATKSRSMWMR